MNPKEFFKLFERGLKDIYKNPIIIVPGLALWVFITVFSKISVAVNYKLSNSISISAWFLVFSLVMLGVMAFVFSGLIEMGKKVIKKKVSFEDFIGGGDNFWFRNFWIILALVVVGAMVGRIAYYGAWFIGEFFRLEVGMARLVFILIYFAELFGVLIFLSFSVFSTVIYNLKIIKGARFSIKFVRKNYPAALAMNVVLFVILFLINKLPSLFGEFLEYGLFIPFFAVVLARFILELGKNVHA